MAINPNGMGGGGPSQGVSTGKNMLEQSEELKGWPDQRLMQEYNSPTTATPQVVILSELNRRADMRARYDQAMSGQPDQPPVDEQVMAKLMGMNSPQGGPPQGGPPQGGPPQGGPPQGGPPQGMPPQGMPPQGGPPMGGPPMGGPPRGGPPMGRPGGGPPGRPPMGPMAPKGMAPRGMALGGLIKRYEGGGMVENDDVSPSVMDALVPFPGLNPRRGKKPRHLTGNSRSNERISGDSAKSILEELLGIRLRHGGMVKGYRNGGEVTPRAYQTGVPDPRLEGFAGGLKEEDMIRYRILQGRDPQELSKEDLEWMNKITSLLSNAQNPSGPPPGMPPGMANGGRVKGYLNGGAVPKPRSLEEDLDEVLVAVGGAGQEGSQGYIKELGDYIRRTADDEGKSLTKVWESIQKQNERQREINLATSMMKAGERIANTPGGLLRAAAAGGGAFGESEGKASNRLTDVMMNAELGLSRDRIAGQRSLGSDLQKMVAGQNRIKAQEQRDRMGAATDLATARITAEGRSAQSMQEQLDALVVEREKQRGRMELAGFRTNEKDFPNVFGDSLERMGVGGKKGQELLKFAALVGKTGEGLERLQNWVNDKSNKSNLTIEDIMQLSKINSLVNDGRNREAMELQERWKKSVSDRARKEYDGDPAWGTG